MNLAAWKKRYTVRRFDTDFIPPKESINQLVKCMEYVPLQLGNIDHLWTVLGPNDAEIKRWLVDNIYYTNDEEQGHKEYFTMLAEAPYVFHSFRLAWDNSLFRQNKLNEVVRNNSFHAGVLLSEALKLDLDVAQICCTDGYKYDYERKHRFYIDFMLNRHESLWDLVPVDRDQYWIEAPMISVAVGKGLPNTTHMYTPYKDGVTFTGQKDGKIMNNCWDFSNGD